MDQKNLALIEELMTEMRALKAQARNGLPLSDKQGARFDEILSELEENGCLEEATEELNAGRHRAIRPDVSYNPYHASAYRERRENSFQVLGQLQSVYRAAQPGQKVDDRLFRVNEAFEKRAGTGLSEGIPSDAGFMVEGSFTTDLVKKSSKQVSWQNCATRCRSQGAIQ